MTLAAMRSAGLAGLALLALLPLASGVRVSVHDAVEVKAVPVNKDRMQCLRQDELDLVMPSSGAYAVRQVLGIGGDTSSDIYLSADNIFVSSLDARVTIKRKSGFEILLELGGAGRELGKMSALLTGFNLICRSRIIEAGAAAVVWDKRQMAEGQPVDLAFKLSARGTLVHDEELDTWDIELKSNSERVHYADMDGDMRHYDSNSDEFRLSFKNQHILEELANRFGNLDKLVIDGLFNAVVAALPKGLIGSMAYISKEDLNFEANVDLNGTSQTQSAPNSWGPLQVQAAASISLETDPAKLLKTVTDRFEPRALARRRITQLWNTYNLQDMFQDNLPMLQATLKRYGVSEETLAGLHNMQSVNEALLAAAEASADGLVRALQPFMSTSGQRNDLFEGLDVGVLAEFHMDSREGTTVQTGSLKTLPPLEHVLSAPAALLDAVGLKEKLSLPKPGSATAFSASNIRLNSREVHIDMIELQQLRVRVRNESSPTPQAKIYIVNGRVRDMALTLPEAMNTHAELHTASCSTELSPSGDLRVNLDNDGWLFRTEAAPSPPAASGKTRDGPPTTLDGAVPEGFARPSEPAEVLDLARVAPKTDFGATLTVHGKGGRLAVKVSATAKASVDFHSFLKPILAGRPSEDFGYTFSSQLVTWVSDEDTFDDFSGPRVVAVVSCGFLRLLKKGPQEGLLNRVNMKPENGQLHVDLAEYDAAPARDSRGCILLYSSGVKARRVGGVLGYGSREVTDKLCALPGREADLNLLLSAIQLQINRFKDDRAKSKLWKYGTHLATAPQFKLPGLQTRDLAAIVDSTV